jgi:putative transposase
MDSGHYLYPLAQRIRIGWELGRSLRVELAMKALKMALNDRTWQPGVLIHHSDRGVQYASREYTESLVAL